MRRRNKRMRIANGERQMVRPRLRLAIAHSPFAAVLVGALLAVGSPAAAQDYPARPIELVVPFPPGGGADVGARMVSQIAGESLGQPIVIQNKAGATGAIGSEYVARAAADGYTLLLATGSTHAVLPAYRADLPYDTVTSFAPATLVAIIPNMLVVNPTKVPVATIAELIAYLKQHPGKVNFASSGPGSSIHFAAELFKLMTHTEMTHVAYRGSAPALSDLLAGNVDLIFDNMPVVWPQVQQGRLRALGVASLERTPLAPDLPAIAEALPGYEAVSWVGIVAPAGTPPAIVDRISRAFGAAAVRADVAARFKDLGYTPARDTPAEFAQFIRADRAKWQRVARDAHLSAK
jgi:tripartite-type tricarboxylate transporter receptor subunit TctC